MRSTHKQAKLHAAQLLDEILGNCETMKTRDLFSFVSGLSGVTRFSMLKMCHAENVLEHTGMIVIFALVLGNRLNAVEGQTRKFNLQLLLEKAIVHDWDECITGDVPRPTKYFSRTLREELGKLENAGVIQLTEKLGVPLLANVHDKAKEGAEGCLVALCDVVCAIHRCWEEALVFNNMHFVLPATRLQLVMNHAVKNLEQFVSKEQFRLLNDFALEMYYVLNAIINHNNGELKDMSNAN